MLDGYHVVDQQLVAFVTLLLHKQMAPTVQDVYWKRFSAAFQLMTFQMALKYSALRFW
jgi:hypothetical protein